MSKGAKHKTTLDKEAQREVLRQMVFARFAPLIDAQIANAQGIKSLVYRDGKTGKFVPVKVGQLEELTEQGKVIEVWEDKPNVSAFQDLMNRALDKPKEQPIEVDVTVQGLDERIRAARQRVKAS